MIYKKSSLDCFLQQRISNNSKELKNALNETLQTEQDCFEQILLSINHCKKNIAACEKRLDESDYENVSLSPKEYKQDQLDLFANNIKASRTDLDLLYGSMLAWGVRLDLPLQTETVDGCTIYTFPAMTVSRKMLRKSTFTSSSNKPWIGRIMMRLIISELLDMSMKKMRRFYNE